MSHILRIMHACTRARCAAIGLALAGGLTALPEAARAQSRALLKVEPSEDGLSIEARRAVVTDVLEALSAEAGFDVLVADAPKRALVNATVRDRSVEDVLREVLRDRNYALVYANGAVTQVILLEPSGSSPPSRPVTARANAATRRANAAARKKAAARGPTVVRF